MKPDLKAMRSKLDEKNSEIMQSEVLELLAYAEKLEAVADMMVEAIHTSSDATPREQLCVMIKGSDALRAAGWEV